MRRRSGPQRLRRARADRLLWVWLSRVWTEWRAAVVIVQTRDRHRDYFGGFAARRPGITGKVAALGRSAERQHDRVFLP